MISLCFEVIFWLSVAFIIIVTFGYPLAVFVLSRCLETEKMLSDAEPTVSLIIGVYNEEKVIRKKIVNSLELDYPKEKLEIIVASDGSSDDTCRIAGEFKDKGVKVLDFYRMGKTGVQNKAVKEASGKIFVFSDANAMYEKDAIKKLVRNFGDDRIGCVCGQLKYKSDVSSVGAAEKLYWDYEKLLKESESRLFSLIGVNGSIYAVRKDDYMEIDDQLISDLVEPLEIVKRGKRVVYEAEAVSLEEPSLSYENEFSRKVRILTRSIQGLLYENTLFNPLRYGFFSLQILIHKLFRYLVPLFLIMIFVSLLFLLHDPVYHAMFSIYVMLLVFALIGRVMENVPVISKIFGLFYYYFMVNFALIKAWVNVLKGEKYIVWATRR